MTGGNRTVLVCCCQISAEVNCHVYRFLVFCDLLVKSCIDLYILDVNLLLVFISWALKWK